MVDGATVATTPPADCPYVVTEWDIVERLWQYALEERLCVQSRETPILLVEPSVSSKVVRETYVYWIVTIHMFRFGGVCIDVMLTQRILE